MPRALFIAPLLMLLGVLSGLDSHAQWMPGGALVNGNGGSDDIPRVVPDDNGGAYVVWRRFSPSSGSDIFLQHLTAAGTIAPGWQPTGLPLAGQPLSQGLMQMIADGEGGAIIIWYDFQLDPETGVDNVIQRIRSDGSVAPGWPSEGLRIRAPGSQNPARIASNGAGGVYVLWEDARSIEIYQNDDIYALHVLADGSVAPGWPPDGLPIALGPPSVTVSEVVPDAQGGAFFLWADGRNGLQSGESFGVRTNADGSTASGWTPGGKLLSPGQYRRGTCSDGAGGFYLWTADHAPVWDLVYRLRRFTADSSPAPGWPAEGIVVCDAPADRTGVPVVPDGLGGIIATWVDFRRGRSDIFALRVLPDATIAPGWTVNGSMISDPLSPYYEGGSTLAPDGAGGAYAVWSRDEFVSVQHLTPDGHPAPGWPDYGVLVDGACSEYDQIITSDGEGGAIVVWVELCAAHRGMWAQRYVADGIVAAELALVSAVAEADRVRLDWFGAGASGLRATVQRRSTTTPWATLSTITSDGTGHLRYDDLDVRPGARYGYRLGSADGSGGDFLTSEAWVEIPAALELALDGFRPNPAVGHPRVAFTLPRGGAGKFELYDLAGRRVVTRDLGGLPAGRHSISLEIPGALSPGAYVLCLTHGGRVLTARGVVVR